MTLEKKVDRLGYSSQIIISDNDVRRFAEKLSKK